MSALFCEIRHYFVTQFSENDLLQSKTSFYGFDFFTTFLFMLMCLSDFSLTLDVMILYMVIFLNLSYSQM